MGPLLILPWGLFREGGKNREGEGAGDLQGAQGEARSGTETHLAPPQATPGLPGRRLQTPGPARCWPPPDTCTLSFGEVLRLSWGIGTPTEGPAPALGPPTLGPGKACLSCVSCVSCGWSQRHDLLLLCGQTGTRQELGMRAAWVAGLLENLSGGWTCSWGLGSRPLVVQSAAAGQGRRWPEAWLRLLWVARSQDKGPPGWVTCPGRAPCFALFGWRQRSSTARCPHGGLAGSSQCWLQATPPERPHTLSPAISSAAEGCGLASPF